MPAHCTSQNCSYIPFAPVSFGNVQGRNCRFANEMCRPSFTHTRLMPSSLPAAVAKMQLLQQLVQHQGYGAACPLGSKL